MKRNELLKRLDENQMRILEDALDNKTIEQANLEEVCIAIAEQNRDEDHLYQAEPEDLEVFDEINRYLNSQKDSEEIRKQKMIEKINSDLSEATKTLSNDTEKYNTLPELMETLSYYIGYEMDVIKYSEIEFGFAPDEVSGYKYIDYSKIEAKIQIKENEEDFPPIGEGDMAF